MGKYFGTDGFRDETNVDLTVEHIYKIGHFLGWCYGQKMPDEHCRVVIGRDARRSSYVFEYPLVAGSTASGASAYLLHVTTIPSVSYMVRTEGFNCGIMMSASHNPFCDNGVEVVNERGEELEESVILEMEKYLDGRVAETPLAKKEHIGRTVGSAAGRDRCVGYLISVVTRSFKNIKVALDCSSGSASTIAKNVSDALGMETHVMNNEPNGLNINMNCGSTHTECLQKFMVDKKCDIGLIYDSDTDRCIAVDKNGYAMNSDGIVYICDKYMRERGDLFNNTVVIAIMFNFGLYKAFNREGIVYVRAAVGDKCVYENMAATGHCLGGEQFGHIIFSKRATTRDGTLTSLKVTEIMLEKRQSLDKLALEVEIYPQVLKDVRIKDKKTAQDDETVQAEIAKVTRSLDSDGRILLRQLGTEPVVHVMVGAPDIQTCEIYVDQVIQIMKDRGHCI